MELADAYRQATAVRFKYRAKCESNQTHAIPQRDRECLRILQKVAQFRCFITVTAPSSEAKPGLAAKNSESNQMRAALETSLGTRAERVLLLTDQCTNRETYGPLGRLNWDLAMLVELAKKDEDAMEALAKALAVIRERWEPETTARNVRTVGEVIRKGKSGKSNEFGMVVKP
jgi:hypothetical protein